MPIYDSDEPIFFDTGLRYDMDEPPANSRRPRQMNSSSLRISRFVTRLSAKLRFESAGKQVSAFELRKTWCAATGIGVLRIGDSKTSAFPIRDWERGKRLRSASHAQFVGPDGTPQRPARLGASALRRLQQQDPRRLVRAEP